MNTYAEIVESNENARQAVKPGAYYDLTCCIPTCGNTMRHLNIYPDIKEGTKLVTHCHDCFDVEYNKAKSGYYDLPENAEERTQNGY